MSSASAALLGAFWSWTDGVAAVLLLGFLLPATLGAMGGFVPLMHARRDWRVVLPLSVSAVLFAAAGALALAVLGAGAPGQDFWAALSLQFAVVVLLLSFGAFLRASVLRARRDRTALEAIRTFVPEDRGMTEAQRPGPRAALRAIEAEYYVAEWMRWLGAVDAVVTRGRDEGVHVRSAHYVAQVKHRPRDFVSVDVVRALHGVAAAEGRTGLVFASGRFSTDALAFAARADVALFVFRPAEGRLVPANTVAQRLTRDGLHAGVPQPV